MGALHISFQHFIFLLFVVRSLTLLLPSKEIGFKHRGKLTRLLSGPSTEVIPKLATQPPLKVLLLVEPTPFNYVSGYANRFKEMLNYFKKAGDDVYIMTPDRDKEAPKEYNGFKIESPRGFELFMYKHVTCTFDFRFKIKRMIKSFQPDLIHCSTPSAIVYPAALWAKLFNIPLVMSYHTDLAGYAKSYLPVTGSVGLSNFLVKFFHQQADLVLATSPQLKKQMEGLGIDRVDVWQKGINAEVGYQPC